MSIGGGIMDWNYMYSKIYSTSKEFRLKAQHHSFTFNELLNRLLRDYEQDSKNGDCNYNYAIIRNKHCLTNPKYRDVAVMAMDFTIR